MVALFIPLAKWIKTLSPENLFLLVVTFVIYLGITVVLGAFIHFVSYIPFNLSGAFDPIKNDIASGEIKDVDDFGTRVTEFITEFFDFSFLDIEYALFQGEHTDIIVNPEAKDILNSVKEFDLIHISKQGDEISKVGKISVGKKSFHLYIVPVWFGDHWLGYMGLLSSKKVSRFFLEFLQEFESNYIDDQLMHVLNYSNKENS
jgi:hypothetical protein